MIYSWLRPLLFSLPEELAHDIALRALSWCPKALLPSMPNSTPTQLLGLSFPNKIGLAAGLDKNADYLDGLAKLGFGFIELGTITPRAQTGNPKPRLFRLVKDNAIINRMGFNNKGVEHLVKQVKAAKYTGILGINIGKNLNTPVSKAREDYAHCFERVYPLASYITVNVSSPNTPGLRELQHGDLLRSLFETLKTQQQRLSDIHKRYVPMLAKLAPDLSIDALKKTVEELEAIGVDGFVFSNTTNSREALTFPSQGSEKGGLSGQPLMKPSTLLLKAMRGQTDLPIIGVGGIMSGKDAQQKLASGASLIQLYSGLIYQGPKLIQECIQRCANT